MAWLRAVVRWVFGFKYSDPLVLTDWNCPSEGGGMNPVLDSPGRMTKHAGSRTIAMLTAPPFRGQ